MEGFDQPPPAGAQAPMQAKSSLNADPHTITHARIHSHTSTSAHSRTHPSTHQRTLSHASIHTPAHTHTPMQVTLSGCTASYARTPFLSMASSRVATRAIVISSL